ncbi:Transcriptional regulator, AcrR family [hydrothermal vent metagenome]|uniref:Transcriptional regulator, AcrR family n=1 Tax=hydrothermal vent metagenome TaxID=652676 RepID=A0A3B0YS36_9ZZZZ
MARPREFDPSEVLQTAIELFWEKGYYDSSVDEVVRRSGVAKYGIYGTFSSKRELFMKALKQYASERHRDIQSPIRKPNASLPEIQQFFSKAVKIITQSGGQRGCLIVNTGIELGLKDIDIRDFVANFFQETEDVMACCLTNAVALGQLSNLSNISALATYLITEFRTVLMLARSGCLRREIQAHLNIVLKVLD